MKRNILLAVALVALMAAPAFASVQDVKLSGAIDSFYLMRDRLDLEGLNGPGAGQFDQKVFMTQVRLDVDANLSDNVSTKVELLNERAWGEETQDSISNDLGITLNLASVTLKDILGSPASVTIGRQIFQYGNGLIIGNGGPNNSTTLGPLATVASDFSLRTTYDGVKLVLDYKPLTIDAIYSKVDANNLQGSSAARKDDIDLFGTNVNYQLGDERNTVVEAYFFAKIDNSGANTGAGEKADTIYTPGILASTNPITGLHVSTELAMQTGTKRVATADNIQRQAWAGQAIASYQIPLEATKQYNPVASTAYTYVSGDTNPSDVKQLNEASDNIWTAWDPMFEAQSGGKLYNTLFSLSNAHILELAGQVNPLEDVTAKLSWTTLWSDKSIAPRNVGNTTGSLPLPDGGSSSSLIFNNNLDLGQELDADLTYAYTEDVQVALSLGYFTPGRAFGDRDNESARQALVKVGVAF